MAVVVRKNHVQYPCTWKGKKGKWPCDEKKDGIIMQLEARGGNRASHNFTTH